MKKCKQEGCLLPPQLSRFGMCPKHHKEQAMEEAVVNNAARVLQNKSTPTAYKKWKRIQDDKAWRWKTGVVYGNGRI